VSARTHGPIRRRQHGTYLIFCTKHNRSDAPASAGCAALPRTPAQKPFLAGRGPATPPDHPTPPERLPQNICTLYKCFVQKHGIFHPAGGDITFWVSNRVPRVTHMMQLQHQKHNATAQSHTTVLPRVPSAYQDH
jgi:hypothetical protein